MTGPSLNLERERIRQALPIPPPELRALVGPTQPEAFDNPRGEPVYPDLDEAAYDAVFDFGCGCGRVARQLILQEPRPRRYMGIDLHAGMIEWCRSNLAPYAPGFEFLHHDVFNFSFNPGEGKPMHLPFPVEDRAFSLVNAFSVFTHLVESQVRPYISEVERVLQPDGVFQSTWFFFDKSYFPMLAAETNALYISDVDPSAAVIFDRNWVVARAEEAGFVVTKIIPPKIRGFQWLLLMQRADSGAEEATFPPDEAPLGSNPAPPMPENASALGLNASKA